MLPSVVVTVIVVVPAEMALTVPLLTEATAGLLLVHVTDLSDALLGAIVAVSVSLPPICRSNEDLFRLTPVTATACTVTLQEAVMAGSVVEVAVIATVPAATPVTTPLASTVAILLLALFHDTALP